MLLFSVIMHGIAHVWMSINVVLFAMRMPLARNAFGAPAGGAFAPCRALVDLFLR
jgi:hypothetical protein